MDARRSWRSRRHPVDEATVTIENSNWHLGAWKGRRNSDQWMGANPVSFDAALVFACCASARVSCDVLPLRAVARPFLFVPNGEAVMFADDLVVHPVAQAWCDRWASICLHRIWHTPEGAEGNRHRPRNRWFRFSINAASSANFQRIRTASANLAGPALANAGAGRIFFRDRVARVSAVGVSFPAGAFIIRQKFLFPYVDKQKKPDSILIARFRTQNSHPRSRKAPPPFARRAKAIRRSFRPLGNRHSRDNIGHADRGITDLQQHRVIVRRTAISNQAERRSPRRGKADPTNEYVQALREQLPRAFPPA